MAARKLPRSNGAGRVILAGGLWDVVADMLERFGRFKVAPPLELKDEPGGWLLSARITPGRVSFDARITSSAQDGTNKRWLYDVTEVEPDGDNWTWNDKSGGRVVTARNRFEVPNGASGLYGNGVSSVNLTGTFDIQPIPNGVIVDVEVRTAADSTTVYWFEAMNGIDGTCP